MPSKLTNEEFLKRLKEKAPTLEALEEYVKSDISIKFKCTVCGHVFYNTPIRILGTRNQGCAKCYHNTQKISNEEFLERAKVNKHVKIIGKYKGSRDKIEVECSYCNKKFFTRAEHIWQNRGHLSCMEKMVERKPTMTQEDFLEKLKMITDTIVPLDTYVKNSEKMKFKCLVCGKIWTTQTGHVLHGESGCPYCRVSNGEKKVEKFLLDNRINYIKEAKFEDCKDKLCLPFDFYLPDYNVCIEYDGEQHVRPAFGEKPFIMTVLHDAMKNNYCKWNNINLIRIPHTDFDNIEVILTEFIKKIDNYHTVKKLAKKVQTQIVQLLNL